MIVLRNLTKVFSIHGRRKVVADNINVTFPAGVSVGLLGRNGAGKSTLLQLISGTTTPTSGEVLSSGSISFPVGLATSLHPDMTGAQNTLFVARIYGADTESLKAYVEEFAELGDHFHLPVRTYSSGMRGRLSFGINMGLKFDTYLVDEVTAVGDASFRKKSSAVFLSRMENAGAIFVSHSMGMIREMCTAGAFLENGKLQYYPDVEDAIEEYGRLIDSDAAVSAGPMARRDATLNFPRDARMLFGIGMPQTRLDWVGDCLRRHRPCHFGATREPHYFDIRAGREQKLYGRRTATLEQLAMRMRDEDSEARRNTVNLLGEVSNLLAIHSAPPDGPERHKAYLDYTLTGRKSQPIVCDFTPTYAMLDEDSFAEMALIGDALFTCVLRDPADRLWADLWMGLAPRSRTPERCILAAETLLAAPDDLSERPETDYAACMARLESKIAPERILYLFHENLVDRAALEPLSDFLGVPNVPQISLPPLPEETVPPAPAFIYAALRSLLEPQYVAAQERFGDRLPTRWRAQNVSDPLRPTDA